MPRNDSQLAHPSVRFRGGLDAAQRSSRLVNCGAVRHREKAELQSCAKLCVLLQFVTPLQSVDRLVHGSHKIQSAQAVPGAWSHDLAASESRA